MAAPGVATPDLSGLAQLLEAQANFLKALQEADGLRLDNVKKLNDITWTQFSRYDLYRNAKKARKTLELALETVNSAKRKLSRLNIILSGEGSASLIVDGWNAFEFFSRRTPSGARKIADMPLSDDVFDPSNWHFNPGVMDIFDPIQKRIRRIEKKLDPMKKAHDWDNVVDWAKENNCIPKTTTAAWKAFDAYIAALHSEAKKDAAMLESAVPTAKADADKLNEKIWEATKPSSTPAKSGTNESQTTKPNQGPPAKLSEGKPAKPNQGNQPKEN